MVKCEFWLEENGKCLQCGEEGDRIIRCFDVCFTHYNLLCRDNKKRMLNDVDIPQSLELLNPYPKSIKGLCKKEIKKPLQKVIEQEDVENYNPEVIIDDKEEENIPDKLSIFQ